MARNRKYVNMKSNKVPFIHERVVRHLSREHYHLSFCEEQEMHARNEGKITWFPLVLSVLVTGFMLNLPFWVGSSVLVPCAVSSILYVPIGIYSILESWRSYRKMNAVWKQMTREDIAVLKAFADSGSGEPLEWSQLVKQAKKKAEDLGRKLVQAQKLEAEMEEETKKAEHEVRKFLASFPSEQQLSLLARIDGWHLKLKQTKERAAQTRLEFIAMFDRLKRAIGGELDNGHGYEAFMKKLTA